MQEYQLRLNLAMSVLNNNHEDFTKKLNQRITQHKKNLAFEKAKHLTTYIQNINIIFDIIQTHIHQAIQLRNSASTNLLLQQNNILKQLQDFLQIPYKIQTIDCFDVSHCQGTYIVGSCVRFTNGILDKNNIRRFMVKTITKQNDYAALQEIVSRRYKNQANIPDLIFIDGGKGQLNAIQSLFPNANCASLAKKEEILYSRAIPRGKHLDIHSGVGKFFMQLRDHAHRNAVAYHRLKKKKQYASNDTTS